MKKEKIIYIYPTTSAFVKKDLEFLSKKYDLIVPDSNWNNKKNTPFLFLKQFFYLLRYLYAARAVFVMFGGYWAFLPALFGKILKKPVFIILGGTDCVSFPSINYGSLGHPLLRLFIKWSYQLCTLLVPVDESLVLNTYSYYEDRVYDQQGYKFFFPLIKTPYRVVHNGFDIHLFQRDHSNQKEPNSFITVATTADFKRFKLKGVDRIVELAKAFPQCSFTVVGMSDHIVQRIEGLPDNFTAYGFLPPQEFKNYLSKSEFYVQLSISEGFPNAVCEGMLCECIPIGSSVGAIPFIIQDTGFIMESSNFDYLKQRFETIINLNPETKKELARKARLRVVEHFRIEKREKLFLELVEKYAR